MKKLSVLIALGLLVALVSSVSAQIVPNSVPPLGAVPGVWNVAGIIGGGTWTARVSWQIATPVAGFNDYWYKVDALTGDTLKSSTIDVNPGLIQNIAGVYQFGQIDALGNNPGQSWGAEPVVLGDTSVRWSTQGGLFNGLVAGETEYYWLRSPWPAGPTNLTLQDGTVAQIKVPGPAPVPEPASMALVAFGLSAVAGLRKRAR